MPVTKRIKEISFGGYAVNNPTNYSWSTYADYPDLDTSVTYIRMNLSYFDDSWQTNVQVTGLVTLNAQGQPLLGPNDLVQLPCPPACN
jgi:hypothetical protein